MAGVAAPCRGPTAPQPPPLLDRVVIVGAGISGLVTALALQAKRVVGEVVVLERDADERFELQGYHFYWDENDDLRAALEDIGLWEEVFALRIRHDRDPSLDAAVPADGGETDAVALCDSRFRDILIAPSPDAPEKIGDISRGRLRHFLLHRFLQSGRGRVVFGSTIREVAEVVDTEGSSARGQQTQRRRRVAVSYTSPGPAGPQPGGASSETSTSIIHCDLLVGADGANSVIRRFLWTTLRTLRCGGAVVSSGDFAAIAAARDELLHVKDAPGDTILVRGKLVDSRQGNGVLFPELLVRDAAAAAAAPRRLVCFAVIFDARGSAFFISFYEGAVIWLGMLKGVTCAAHRAELLSRDPDRVKRGVLQYVVDNDYHRDVVDVVRRTNDGGEEAGHAADDASGGAVAERLREKQLHIWAERSRDTCDPIPDWGEVHRLAVAGDATAAAAGSVPRYTLGSWLARRVVLVGDAAHVPLLSGGLKAMLDGVALARALHAAADARGTTAGGAAAGGAAAGEGIEKGGSKATYEDDVNDPHIDVALRAFTATRHTRMAASHKGLSVVTAAFPAAARLLHNWVIPVWHTCGCSFFNALRRGYTAAGLVLGLVTCRWWRGARASRTSSGRTPGPESQAPSTQK